MYLIYGQNGQNTSYSRYASYLPFQIRYSAVTRRIAIMGHKELGWKTYDFFVCPLRSSGSTCGFLPEALENKDLIAAQQKGG